MKKLVFLLSFLITFSAFAEDPKRGGEKPIDSVYTQPCSLKNSPLNLIASLSSKIDKRYNEVSGSKTYIDSENAFPAVGMINLAGDQAGHGSATLVGIKDKNGNILRNKVVTSAHNLFDDNGNLRVPIETMEFLMGTNVLNEDYSFKIKKIQCIDFRKDQCILTLDRDVPNHIPPMTPVTNPEPYVKNADYLFFVGYPSWVPSKKNRNKRYGQKGERFFSECKTAKRWKDSLNDLYTVGCNAYGAQSGGAFVASKKQADGSWKDYYIGMPSALAPKKGLDNVADTFRYNDLNSFNNVVVTRENQRQFFASN